MVDNSTNNYRARSRMLDVIRKSAPVTRPALAKETRLTSAAVGLHVASLLDEGLIEEVGYGESIGGRMPVKIDIARKSNCTLGVALHDGELLGNVADFGDHSLFMRRERMRPRDTRQQILDSLDQIVEQALGLIAKHQLRQRHCVVAISGHLDAQTGRIIDSVHFPKLNNFDVREHLLKQFNLQCEAVYVTHAVFCGVLEGDMRNEHVGLISWNTGVGWTQARGENLQFTNANPGVRRISHLKIRPDGGRACHCGRSGCLESELGGLAILQRLAETGEAKYAHLDLPGLAALAQAADPTVVEMLSGCARELGQHLAPAVFLSGAKYLRIETCLGLDHAVLVRNLKQGLAQCMHADQIDALDIAVVPDADAALLKGVCRLARGIFFDGGMIRRLREEM
ncbi:MAG: ROK family transcriptional regulator [Planctomycetes bacterium]|jgi:N-acetylglucosamine repressor|nr:ROK family transcriptional regulator [Planctomycetota bacterium]